MKSYLSWKDMRKSAKERDGGPPVDPDELIEDQAGAGALCTLHAMSGKATNYF